MNIDITKLITKEQKAFDAQAAIDNRPKEKLKKLLKDLVKSKANMTLAELIVMQDTNEKILLKAIGRLSGMTRAELDLL